MMHAKTMEGLIGAKTNIAMANVPMKVFKEARQKGDTATMERAMGYVNDCEERADDYNKKAEEGLKEEAKEAREKEKRELEKTIEKRREDNEKFQDRLEENRDIRNDTIELSEEGKALLENTLLSDTTDVANQETDNDSEPVLYTNTGEAKKLEQGSNISISV